MKKIAIIIPYFGKIPPIFEAWLISAESNKNIDFIIYTDDISIKKYKVTDNIKIYIESFDDFKQRFQEKINFKISLDYPYKICDYRPMYGLVLSDLLKEYDFWGFGDFDVVLGDLSQYITNDVLNSFDRIFNYGALSLYKNDYEMNNLFRRENKYKDCLSYKYVYRTNFSLYFDEMGGHKYGYGQSIVALREKNIKILMNKVCADVKPKSYNFELYVTNEKYDYFEFIDGKLWGIKNGKKIKEFVYLHLQKRKIEIENNLNKDAFYIGPSIICNKESKVISNYKNKFNKRKFIKMHLRSKWNNFNGLMKQNAPKYIFNSLFRRINDVK
ncbi:DUF6625 family protein [Lactobacillus helveticus]|uniref:Uncharacterized protein n=1 Tax=Lactobacillus helveticus TaxID=1587 RepID=A0A6A7K1Z7_LACHE|nr:DUF6625 family protein [Lactobacillus helveticus]MPW14597.1 hypothetical protein [Lactobacillus helveticus]